MKTMIKKAICTTVILASFLLSVQASATWTGQQSLHRVYASSGTISVQTAPSSAHINPGGCAASSNYALDPNGLLFKEKYQMLLTALASNRKVSLDISGCQGSYPKLANVIIF